MQAMLNPVMCAAFHPCWRAMPRYNCCNMAPRQAASPLREQRTLLQRHEATAYDTRLVGTVGEWPQSSQPEDRR